MAKKKAATKPAEAPKGPGLGKKYCPHCHATIAARSTTCPECKAEIKPKKKKKGKPGRKPGANGAAPVAAHHALDTAFEFVTKVGGLLHAEQLIGKLRSIKEKL